MEIILQVNKWTSLILMLFIFWTLCANVFAMKQQHLRLTESKTINKVEGGHLQVTCIANVSTPPTSLKWRREANDGSKLQQIIETNNTVVLHISELNGSDAGRYTCELVMADSYVETADFYLLVKRRGQGSQACSNTQFKCKESNTCLFTRFFCDGFDDCGDGSDEVCGEINPCLKKFLCNNSRCVDHSTRCNHIDDCGDQSDERFCDTTYSTTSKPNDTDDHFSWLKTTVYIVIAVTIGVVISISSIVIIVYRVKMKRRRERRLSQELHRLYRLDSTAPPQSGPGENGQSDQHPFLSQPQQYPHYGNIIVNVNNGVQYMPGLEYSVFMDAPPPYSEVGSGDNQNSSSETSPPPYSTLASTDPLVPANSNSDAPTCDETGKNTTNVPQRMTPSVVQSFLGGVQQIGSDRNSRERSTSSSIRSSGNSEEVRNLRDQTDSSSASAPPLGHRIATKTYGPLPNISSEFLESLLLSHGHKADLCSIQNNSKQQSSFVRYHRDNRESTSNDSLTDDVSSVDSSVFNVRKNSASTDSWHNPSHSVSHSQATQTPPTHRHHTGELKCTKTLLCTKNKVVSEEGNQFQNNLINSCQGCEKSLNNEAVDTFSNSCLPGTNSSSRFSPEADSTVSPADINKQSITPKNMETATISRIEEITGEKSSHIDTGKNPLPNLPQTNNESLLDSNKGTDVFPSVNSVENSECDRLNNLPVCESSSSLPHFLANQNTMFENSRSSFKFGDEDDSNETQLCDRLTVKSTSQDKLMPGAKLSSDSSLNPISKNAAESSILDVMHSNDNDFKEQTNLNVRASGLVISRPQLPSLSKTN